MKKYLLLIIMILTITSLSVSAATKISAVASPLRVTAGEEVKITVYCVDTTTNKLQKGILIKFSVAAGGGKITPASAASDESGVVKAMLITGPKSGTNAVKVEGPAVNTVYVSVNSEAMPPSEFSVKVEPDKIYPNQTAALVVVVKNAKGELLKDAEVKIKPASLVSVTPASSRTDAAGTVKAVVRSARQTGSTRIEVTVAGLDEKNIEFEVMAASAKNIETSAGSLNIGTRNKTTLTARILDNANEPMSNVPVNFQIDSGDASLSASQATTDSRGACRVELTAGNTAGVVSVKISSGDFKTVNLRINVSSVVLPPAFLGARVNETGIFAGDETTVTATVEDKDRRLLSGAAVKFELASGGGSLLSSSEATDGGRASTVFTAGLTPGKAVIKVSCGNLSPVMITVNIEASAGRSAEEKSGKAAKILISANNMYPALLTKPMVTVLVTDSSNIPVFGAQVKFSSESNAAVTGVVKTNSSGEASTPVSYFGLGKIKINAESEGQSRSIQLAYKIPEWVYLFPSVVLFAIVFLLYLMKTGSLKRKLISLPGGLNSDLFVKQQICGFLARKKTFAACFIDIDGFNDYNIAAGFARGDKVIAGLAEIVRKNVPLTDIAAHLGGDDFVYICDPLRAKSIAGKITADFETKLPAFYAEEDYRKGFIAVKQNDGILFNYPLIKLSIAVAEPEKAAARTYNELFEFAGKLLKSAKVKKKEKIIDAFDDESERGTKKVKIGWFTAGAIVFALLLPGFLNAEADITKKMKLSSAPESAGAGQTVKLTARLTDNRDRPIPGAFIIFEDLNRGKGIGSFSQIGKRTGKDGKAEIYYTAGEKTGKAMVKASFKNDTYSSIFISVHVNYLRYVYMLVGLVFLSFTILYFLKLLKLVPLFKGIDPETGMRTRISAENKIKALFKANVKFQVLFIDLRDFTGFNREYGYAEGLKAVKVMSEQIRSIINEFAPRDGEVFSYGEDKFVVVTEQPAEKIAKSIIEEMEIHIPLICQDKNANYYLLHLSVALVEADLAKVKTLGEIMQIAGRLISEAKTGPGSTFLKG